MKTILIVEDDPAILLGLENSLSEEGYKVIKSSDGKKGYEAAKVHNPDVILLDIMLPSKNGLDVCKDLRKDNIQTPIIMLTSKKEEIDKVIGLEIGADDYVTKPFSLRELLARVKVQLRKSDSDKKGIESYQFGSISLNFTNMEGFNGKEKINFSAKELKILKYFAEKEGEVISRNQLLDDIWGYENFPTTRTVDNYILSIRKKIEKDPGNPVHLLTVHTVGYRFNK